jgi:hypothetical protein
MHLDHGTPRRRVTSSRFDANTVPLACRWAS